MKKEKFIAVRLDPDLHYAFKMKALRKKISIQQLIEQLILEYLEAEYK